MSFEPNNPKLIYVQMDKAITPPAGLINHIKDHWWCVHPTDGVIFFRPDNKWPHPGTPQANSNRDIAESFIARMYPWAELKFIPSVFHPINPQDWAS